MEIFGGHKMLLFVYTLWNQCAIIHNQQYRNMYNYGRFNYKNE